MASEIEYLNKVREEEFSFGRGLALSHTIEGDGVENGARGRKQ
jgi:hypothetical protein